MSISLFDRVSVIIPQWNEWELTANCVGSLKSEFGSDLEIIVVDDGSDKETVELSERYLSKISILKKQHRQGVTKAWNIGTRHARNSSDYIIFLNNDVISNGDWISPLIDRLAERSIAAVGLQNRIEKRLPNSVLEKLPTKQFLEGWCLAVRRSDFESLNGFDERMFLYWSDTDFQLRLFNDYLKRNITPILSTVKSDLIRHLGHQTSKKVVNKSKQWREDRDAFLSIWG